MFERNKIKRKARICLIMMCMFGALLVLGVMLTVVGGAEPIQSVVLPLLGVIACAVAYHHYKLQAAADEKDDEVWPEE